MSQPAERAGRSADDPHGPHVGAPEDRLDLHRLAERGRVEHQAVTDVHADVADVGEEEHQVTRLQLAPRDVLARVPLIAGEVRQADPDLGVGPHDQAGAVEIVRPGTAPDVGITALGQREPECLDADRVARDRDVRIRAGPLEDRHGLRERGTVQHVSRRWIACTLVFICAASCAAFAACCCAVSVARRAAFSAAASTVTLSPFSC